MGLPAAEKGSVVVFVAAGPADAWGIGSRTIAVEMADQVGEMLGWRVHGYCPAHSPRVVR